MNRDDDDDLLPALEPNGAAPTTALGPLAVLRTETALSRFPVHRIAKRGDVRIELKNQAAAVLWRVGYSSEYGQPGPLAYKLDTLVINRRIEEAGKPVPKCVKLGSLREVADEVGTGEKNTSAVKNALLQNAFAGITAKITYKRSDGSERFLEAAFTRYSVIFTGETLPDGRKADAVYLLLNEIYQEVLSEAQTRPLDYEYMKALPPAAQRFYEIASYQVYAALLHKNPRAKLTYSDYCTLSTQTRYLDWDHVKKQMYKVHLPHLRSGYLAKVEYEATTDGDGKPDWNMLYTPGPNAAAEFRAFKGGGNRAVQKLGQKLDRKQPAPPAADALALPFPPTGPAPTGPAPKAAATKRAEPPPPAAAAAVLDPDTAALVAELVSQELNHATALLYAKGDPDECRRQLAFVAAMGDSDFREGRGAYLACAIPEKWGPPKRFKAKQQQGEAQKKKTDALASAKARQEQETARQGAQEAGWLQTLGRLEQAHPEALTAFRARVELERRAAVDKFPVKSPVLRKQVGAEFDKPGKQHEIFAAWLPEYEAAHGTLKVLHPQRGNPGSQQGDSLSGLSQPEPDENTDVAASIAASLDLPEGS